MLKSCLTLFPTFDGWLQFAANNSSQAQSPIGVNGTSINIPFWLDALQLQASLHPHAVSLATRTACPEGRNHCRMHGIRRKQIPSHHSKGVKVRPPSQPSLQSGQLHWSFIKRLSQKVAHPFCYATLCPPNRTLARRSLWNLGTTIRKLPVLFFVTVPTAAAFVTTCFLLTVLDWPKPGPTSSLYLFSCHPWTILFSCPSK